MSMGELTFSLDEQTEKKLYDILTDMDTEVTPRFTIHDKYGHQAEYVKVIRCKFCKRWKTQGCQMGIIKYPPIPDGFCYLGKEAKK